MANRYGELDRMHRAALVALVMELEENVWDAKTYCEYILSGVGGHGPREVAEMVADALAGGGLPDDCLEWAQRR